MPRTRQPEYCDRSNRDVEETNVESSGQVCSVSAVLLTFGAVQDAAAQQTVKIGAIYPLSGNAASAGNYSKAAIELAVEIVNNDHPNLKDLPLAEGNGLPGLSGAKIEVVFADNQGTPGRGPEPGACA